MCILKVFSIALRRGTFSLCIALVYYKSLSMSILIVYYYNECLVYDRGNVAGTGSI